jgi:hypothetical protein
MTIGTESPVRDAMDQVLRLDLAFMSQKKNPAAQVKAILPMHLESRHAGD